MTKIRLQSSNGFEDKAGIPTAKQVLVIDSVTKDIGYASALGDILENGLSNVPADQALRIGQLLNGGAGSGGAISVNMISPPLFQREDNNVYLVLRGSNLNLNVNSMSVEILNSSTNQLVATVPNSQVQLIEDGLSLIFYYNFNSLGTGIFKIRLTSGVKSYTTTLDFRIVDSVIDIDFDAITWDKVIDTNVVTTDRSYGSKRTFLLDSSVSSTKVLPATSLLSSVLFNAGEDFYIEILINTGVTNLTQNDITRIGLCYSTTINGLEFLPFHFFGYNKLGGGQALLTKVNPNPSTNRGNGTSTSAQAITISITKIANVVTITDGVQTGVVTISNNSGYRLSAQLAGINDLCSGQIIKAFKIL